MKKIGVGLRDRGFGLRPHAAGQAFRRRLFKAGGVDDGEIEIAEPGLAFAAVAGHARPVVDQRDAPADQPVEQRRLADIRPADNGDGETHWFCFPARSTNERGFKRSARESARRWRRRPCGCAAGCGLRRRPGWRRLCLLRLCLPLCLRLLRDRLHRSRGDRLRLGRDLALGFRHRFRPSALLPAALLRRRHDGGIRRRLVALDVLRRHALRHARHAFRKHRLAIALAASSFRSGRKHPACPGSKSAQPASAGRIATKVARNKMRCVRRMKVSPQLLPSAASSADSASTRVRAPGGVSPSAAIIST